MGCLFCNILEKKIPADVVYEDAHALAFRDIKPAAPTHVLVIPKKHITGVSVLDPSDALIMGNVIVAAKEVAKQLGLAATGFRLVVNDGPDALQSVFHIHVHVLGGRTMSWPPG